MSLLQDVLRSHTLDSLVIEKRLNTPRNPPSPENDSDDDLVTVISIPGTPARTRPSSPTRGAASRPLPGPLHLKTRTPVSRTDPLRVLPTEVSQKIFGRLCIADLARCARVSKKWGKSQTINYVWFQHYRKENFHDDSLPPGKWTKRESKQNWRIIYIQSAGTRSPSTASSTLRDSGHSSRSGSGYQTPREIREEQWRLEAEAAKPSKLEMRSMYKELGGRKSRNKIKLGSSGIRDKGGWDDDDRGW